MVAKKIISIKKKTIWKVLLFFICIIVLGWGLNIETTTRQAINYRVQSIPIPLYLKLFGFFDRHLHYRWLAGRIITNELDGQRKAEALLQWTVSNVAKQPSQLPVIDDHVWHIIVRGYGKADQLADVFATLANYSGLKAFIMPLKGVIGSIPNHIWISAVFFDNQWHVCDVYRQNLFLNEANRWATLQEITASKWQLHSNDHNESIQEYIDYQKYFGKLQQLDFDKIHRKSRSAIQDPFSRFHQFLKDWKL